MQNIFVSYSRKDYRTMRRIVDTLRSSGYKVWIDTEESRVGNYWRKEIASAIQKAEVFVLIISSHSMASPEVQRELNLAGDYNKPILPVLLEELEIPEQMQYLLAGLHWTNLAEGHTEGLAQLLKALEEMGRSAPEDYTWGVHASDFQQLSNLLKNSDKPSAELLADFGNKLAELADKAHEQLMNKLKEHTEKEKQWLEKIRRLSEERKGIFTEMIRMKKIDPEGLAYKVLSQRHRELLEDDLLLTEAHSLQHKEFQIIMKDMDRLRASKKPYRKFIEEIIEEEKKMLKKMYSEKGWKMVDFGKLGKQ